MSYKIPLLFCLVSFAGMLQGCRVKNNPAFFCKCIEEHDRAGYLREHNFIVHIKSDKTKPDAAIAKQCADSCVLQQHDSFFVQGFAGGEGSRISGRVRNYVK